MSINVKCPGCNKSFKAPEKLAGQLVACPGCGDPLAIEAVSPLPSLGDEPPPVIAERRSRPSVSAVAETLSADPVCVKITGIHIPFGDALRLTVVFWAASFVLTSIAYVAVLLAVAVWVQGSIEAAVELGGLVLLIAIVPLTMYMLRRLGA